MSDTKALRRVEIKDGFDGGVTAVFASFNVKDLDDDVTLPGAFEDGAHVRISAYGHASWGPSRGASSVPQPPVGKGVLRVSGDEAVLDGQFFLGTHAGRDHFEVVKEMGDLQEWSYGFDIADSEPGEFEGEKVRFLKRMVVHEVSPVMLGAGIGTRTLAVKASGLKFVEHCESVVTDIDALIVRSAEVVAMRAEKGKDLSEESQDWLKRLDDGMKRLREVLASGPPDETSAIDEVLREYARFQRQIAQL